MVTMEEKNFAKAAERLCITRSPLSKVISEFEDCLGGKLFKRTYSDLEPTELAMNYYSKCKDIYDALLQLESELHQKTETRHVNIIFDISVPELLYRSIIMGFSSEGLVFESQRKFIDYDNIFNFIKKPENIIFSLRDINSQLWDSVDKWKADELVLMTPQQWDLTSSRLIFLIWNDNYRDYIKRGIASRLKKSVSELDFIEHNHDLSGLFYNIHAGKGCVFMTKKLAALYKTDGVIIHQVKNSYLNAFLYYQKSPKQARHISLIKTVLNKFI